MKDFEMFSAVAKMHVNSKREIQKEEVKFPASYHLVAREFNVRWQHLIFNSSSTLFS